MIKIDGELNITDLTYKKLKFRDLKKLFADYINEKSNINIMQITDVYGAYLVWVNNSDEENFFAKALVPDCNIVLSDTLYILHESEFPTSFSIYDEAEDFDALFYDIEIKSFLYKNKAIFEKNIGDFVLQDFISFNYTHNVFIYDILAKYESYNNKLNIINPIKNIVKNDGKKDLLLLVDNIYVFKKDVIFILNDMLEDSIQKEHYEVCTEIINLINLYEK